MESLQKKENVGTIILHRVPTLLTSVNSVTFNDFFHEPFKVLHFESQLFFFLEYFLT